MARIIGVDLGSHSVKLAVMTGAFGRFEVEEYLSEPVAGESQDLMARLDALSTLLSGISRDERLTTAVSFPTEQASVRMISLPFSDKSQIQQTLGFEVEGQVPFDLEEMILTHRILDTDQDGSRVIAALSAKDKVGLMLAGLDEAGCVPKNLVIDGDALGDHASHGVQAIVDIGHQRTLVSICKDGRVWGTRAISYGGANLTQALAETKEISFEEAEALKHRTALRTGYDAEAEWEEESPTNATEPEPQAQAGASADGEILRGAIQPLLASLRASLINFEDSLGIEVSEVLLAGGTANLAGLTRVLKVDLGVRVRRLSVSDIAHAAGHPARFALCHALARRAAGLTDGEEMELRTGAFKFRGDLASMRTAIIGGGVALAAVLLLAVGLVSWKVMDYRAQLEALDAQIASAVAEIYKGEIAAEDITDADDAMSNLQLKAIETMELINLLGAAVEDTPPVVSTIHDLSKSMPPHSKARIDVSTLTITARSLNVEAETDSYDSASTIEAALQASERFKRATKGDDKKVRNGIRFTISVPLNDEDASEEG